MRSRLAIIVSLLAVGCSTPTAIDLSLVTDPNYTDESALLAEIETLELILDAPQGLYPLSSAREMGSMRIEDVDNDGAAELVTSFDVGGKLPMIRVEQGGLDSDVAVDVLVRGIGATGRLASGENFGLSFDEGKVTSRALVFNTLPTHRAPKVMQTVPANGQELDMVALIQIVFSKRMEATALLQPGVVRIVKVGSNNEEEDVTSGASVKVNHQSTANGETSTVTLEFLPQETGGTPTSPLDFGTYRIHVSTDAIEEAGDRRALDQAPGTAGNQPFMAQFSIKSTDVGVTYPARAPDLIELCENGGDVCPQSLVCNRTLMACTQESCECPDPTMVCDPAWKICTPDCNLVGSDACLSDSSVCGPDGLCTPSPAPSPGT